MTVSAQGEFIVVTLSVTNIGDVPQSYFGQNQKLIDTSGREYGANSAADMYMNDAGFGDINPGNAIQVRVAFDVPPRTSPAELELHDSMFSGGVSAWHESTALLRRLRPACSPPLTVMSRKGNEMADQNRPMRPAPGWYPDPGGQPGQRYHDGQRWTQHFVPTPPTVPPAPAPAVAVAVSTGGGTNHALHAVLTFLSCGLWLPIWILVAIFGAGSSSSVAVGSGAGAIARTSTHRPLMIGAAVLAGLFVLGTAAEHPWVLVVLVVLGILAGFGVWAVKSAQKREEQQRQQQFQRDMIASRAEYEDKLYQRGDPRGIHGQYMPPHSPRDADGTDGVSRPR